LARRLSSAGDYPAQFRNLSWTGKYPERLDERTRARKMVPALSRLKISPQIRFEIDVLKHLTYELHIKSPRLKLIEYRGTQIVSDLFDCFEADHKGELLPNDWRDRLREIRKCADAEEMRQRLICDYIAGMTDAYALDVYSRLKTTNPAALFRPI
jgi:dGTPase